VQLDPELRDDPQVVLREKSPELAPVNVIPVMVMLTLPVFRRVTGWELLLVLTAWRANVREAGETVAMGLVPVPVSATCCGLVGSEFATMTAAVRVPLALGVKVTLIVQVAFAASVAAQLLVMP
jgi:hypothetical protein